MGDFNEDDYGQELYRNMTVKSQRLETAKRKLPFNVDNMSKHSLKAKLTLKDSNRSPKATTFKAFESQSEFSAQLDA